MRSLYYLAPVGFSTWLGHVSTAMCTGQVHCLDKLPVFPSSLCFSSHRLCYWHLGPTFSKMPHSWGTYIVQSTPPFSVCFFHLAVNTQGFLCLLIIWLLMSIHLSKLFMFEYNHSFLVQFPITGTFWLPSSFEQLGIRCKPCTSFVQIQDIRINIYNYDDWITCTTVRNSQPASHRGCTTLPSHRWW